MRIEFPAEKIQAKKKLNSIFWENKWKVASIIFSVLLLGAIALKLSLQSQSILKDFFVVEREWQSFQKEGEIDSDLISKLLHKHPELTPIFEHVLIDQKIFQGEVEPAKILVMNSLQRMEFLNSIYTDYTRSSILVEEGQYDVALNQTLALVEKIRAIEWVEYPNIYLFSLLRIGMLSLAKEEIEKAKEAFKEVKEILLEDGSKFSPKVRAQLISHLNSDQLSFFDFIENEIRQ